MDFLIIIFFTLGLVVVHEAGHYVTARRFGWNPKVMFVRNGWLSELGVYAEVGEEEDFTVRYSKLAMFMFSGNIAGLVWLALFFIFGVFDETLFVMLYLVLSAYALYEVVFQVYVGRKQALKIKEGSQ